MLIRTPTFVLDEMICAAQGYVGACVLNILREKTVVKPLNGALCFGGIAFLEKVIYELSVRVIPGPTFLVGHIPIGTKNLVSYGLATYTTLKIMELAGFIFCVPQAITAMGMICGGALLLGSIVALAEGRLQIRQVGGRS